MNKSPGELTPELEIRFAKAHARLDKAKARQPKNNIKKTVLDFVAHAKKMMAKAPEPKLESDFYTEDSEGRVWITESNRNKMLDAEATNRHGNNPNIRLTECSFPANEKNREFLLNHDFGSLIKDSLIALREGKWIYAHGGVGLGKTALTTRVIWELLKDRPRSKASFVSMNNYVRLQIQRETQVIAALTGGKTPDPDTGGKPLAGLVLLDDFDKMNLKSEYNLRTILSLIERLKTEEVGAAKKNRWVLITAQLSIDDLAMKYCGMDDISPLCDRLREMCFVLPKFTGRSKRK